MAVYTFPAESATIDFGLFPVLPSLKKKIFVPTTLFGMFAITVPGPVALTNNSKFLLLKGDT